MQRPNLDDFRDSISIKISEDGDKELWITTVNLEYPFGQVELDEKTAKHCAVAIVGTQQV